MSAPTVKANVLPRQLRLKLALLWLALTWLDRALLSGALQAWACASMAAIPPPPGAPLFAWGDRTDADADAVE